MSGQIEFFPSPNEFTPTTDFVELLVSLLNLPFKSKVLVVEFGNQVTNFANSEGHEVFQVQSHESLEDQIRNIKTNKYYDGAIILPTFSATRPIQGFIEPPDEWDDLGKKFTEDLLIAHATNSLNATGSLVALVPNGLLTNYGRQTMRQGLIEKGLALVATIPPDMLFRDSKRLQISIGLILLQRNYTSINRHITFVDCMGFVNLPDVGFWQETMSQKLSPSSEIVHLRASDVKEDYRLDPQYYDPTYLQIKAPPGYVEYSLGEIADIRGGIAVDKGNRSETKITEESLPYLQVRHILNNGEIASRVLWVEPSRIPDDKARLAQPGDILITVSGTVGKVAIVPEMYSGGVFFDTSIRRIRVDHDYAKPDWVLQFFQSEIGQLQFRRMTSGTAIPQITTPILEAMRIFLPAPSEAITDKPASKSKPKDITGNKAQANLFADAIQENVVNYLRNVKADDGNWNEVIEKTLRSLIEDLVPKSLDKIILEDFPAPIAIPYRRFNMARYNHYERLDRMVSLVESCVYFIFHVLVADFCRHEWKNQVSLTSEAKQALKGMQSIDYRLKFIKQVFEAARVGTITLFMPELVNTDIVEVGDKLRDEVRNPISHSAPGSEPYIRSLIDKYLPSVDKLLESLRFLGNYTLCRIRNHYYQNEAWHYQSEVYRGAEYDLNIQESSLAQDPGEMELITAERDHLILLSPDFETLDVHPFYQLYFGDETSRESHLCFYKHRQGNRLVGESIRSSVEVTLAGIEEFLTLTGVNVGSNNQDS